jgi:excisionase family DNA binding protein
MFALPAGSTREERSMIPAIVDGTLTVLPEQCYTVAETAAMLRISKTTLYREVARGNIVPTGAGRLMRFTMREIRRYQERNRP